MSISSVIRLAKLHCGRCIEGKSRCEGIRPARRCLKMCLSVGEDRGHFAEEATHLQRQPGPSERPEGNPGPDWLHGPSQRSRHPSALHRWWWHKVIMLWERPSRGIYVTWYWPFQRRGAVASVKTTRS